MSPIRKWLLAVLHRPARERAELAEQLISSLDESTDQDAEKAWQKEIRARSHRAGKKQVAFIPWRNVQRRLKTSLRAAS